MAPDELWYLRHRWMPWRDVREEGWHEGIDEDSNKKNEGLGSSGVIVVLDQDNGQHEDSVEA